MAAANSDQESGLLPSDKGSPSAPPPAVRLPIKAPLAVGVCVFAAGLAGAVMMGRPANRAPTKIKHLWAATSLHEFRYCPTECQELLEALVTEAEDEGRAHEVGGEETADCKKESEQWCTIGFSMFSNTIRISKCFPMTCKEDDIFKSLMEDMEDAPVEWKFAGLTVDCVDYDGQPIVFPVTTDTRLTASKTGTGDSVFWAGDGKIYEMHWGTHNGWKKQFQKLNQAKVTKSTLLTSSKKDSGVNVFWPGDCKIYELHWGEHNGWDQELREFDQSTVSGDTHLSACNSDIAESVFWAGEGKIYEMHWGAHNGWTSELQELVQPEVKENTILTSSKTKSGVSVFWPGRRKIYELHWGEHTGWDNPQLDVFEVESVGKNTRLTACKSDNGDSVFWAGDEKIYELHWGTHNGWDKEVQEIEQSLVDSGTVLSSARKDSGVSVFWPGDGKIYELHWGEHNGWQHELSPHPAE
jgi:hypothetical protein